MSFSIKTITLSLCGLALAATSLPTVTTQAQASQPYYLENYVVVSAPRGLNYRDRNCNILKTLPQDTVMSTGSGFEQITCNIKGRNLTLTQANQTFGDGSGGFIYLRATSLIRTASVEAGEPGLNGPTVTATSGLNVRDQNCKRVVTVPNGFKFEDHKAGFGGSMTLCKVAGKYHSMVPVIYNGQIYQVASGFVSFK
jgi:hypothetical protein